MQGGGVPRQLGCTTLVVMVESTDVGKLDNLTEFLRLDGSRIRTVHRQRAVNPPPVVVVEIVCKDSLEVALVEDNHVVKALAAVGADKAFHIRILPGGSGGCQYFFDAEAAYSVAELVTVNAIAVPQ